MATVGVCVFILQRGLWFVDEVMMQLISHFVQRFDHEEQNVSE